MKEEKKAQPLELKLKYEEMRTAKGEADRALKEEQTREVRAGQRGLGGLVNQAKRGILKAGSQSYSLTLKRVHSLGDFYGRFHPSKSKKGVKRSER